MIARELRVTDRYIDLNDIRDSIEKRLLDKKQELLVNVKNFEVTVV